MPSTTPYFKIDVQSSLIAFRDDRANFEHAKELLQSGKKWEDFSSSHSSRFKGFSLYRIREMGQEQTRFFFLQHTESQTIVMLDLRTIKSREHNAANHEEHINQAIEHLSRQGINLASYTAPEPTQLLELKSTATKAEADDNDASAAADAKARAEAASASTDNPSTMTQVLKTGLSTQKIIRAFKVIATNPQLGFSPEQQALLEQLFAYPHLQIRLFNQHKTLQIQIKLGNSSWSDKHEIAEVREIERLTANLLQYAASSKLPLQRILGWIGLDPSAVFDFTQALTSHQLDRNQVAEFAKFIATYANTDVLTLEDTEKALTLLQLHTDSNLIPRELCHALANQIGGIWQQQSPTSGGAGAAAAIDLNSLFKNLILNLSHKQISQFITSHAKQLDAARVTMIMARYKNCEIYERLHILLHLLKHVKNPATTAQIKKLLISIATEFKRLAQTSNEKALCQGILMGYQDEILAQKIPGLMLETEPRETDHSAARPTSTRRRQRQSSTPRQRHTQPQAVDEDALQEKLSALLDKKPVLPDQLPKYVLQISKLLSPHIKADEIQLSNEMQTRLVDNFVTNFKTALTPFHILEMAVIENNVRLTNSLLTAFHKVVVSPAQRTKLHCELMKTAAIYVRVPMLFSLITHFDIDPNMELGESELTALRLVVFHENAVKSVKNQIAAVKMLVQAGARMSAQSETFNGVPPILASAVTRFKCHKLVEALLALGADPNEKFRLSNGVLVTPLDAAIVAENKAVKALKRAGAQHTCGIAHIANPELLQLSPEALKAALEPPNHIKNWEQGAFKLFKNYKHTSDYMPIITAIDAGTYPVGMVIEGKLTFMHFAIFNKDRDFIQELLKRGIDCQFVTGSISIGLRNQDTQAETLQPISGSYIHLLVEMGLFDLIPVFAAHGCNPNALNGSFKTPLQVAASKYATDAVPYLREVGADVHKGWPSYRFLHPFFYRQVQQGQSNSAPQSEETTTPAKATPARFCFTITNLAILMILAVLIHHGYNSQQSPSIGPRP